MVLWRAAARHHDAQNWPAPACVPRLAPQAPRGCAWSRATSTWSGAQRALDLKSYDTIRAAFQMRSCLAKRHAGPGVAGSCRGAGPLAAVVRARAGASGPPVT